MLRDVALHEQGAPVGVEAGDTLGAESPQAVVERLRAAAESNDLAEIAACLAPEDRENVTVGMILMILNSLALIAETIVLDRDIRFASDFAPED